MVGLFARHSDPEDTATEENYEGILIHLPDKALLKLSQVCAHSATNSITLLYDSMVRSTGQPTSVLHSQSRSQIWANIPDSLYVACFLCQKHRSLRVHYSLQEIAGIRVQLEEAETSRDERSVTAVGPSVSGGMSERRSGEANARVGRVVNVVEPLEERVSVDEIEALARGRAEVRRHEIDAVRIAANRRVELEGGRIRVNTKRRQKRGSGDVRRGAKSAHSA